MNILWVLCLVLFIFWLMGFVFFPFGGGFIHLLLVIIVIIVIVRLLQGRGV